MRIVLVLLLLANLTLFAFTRLDSGSGEGMLLQDQVQPDKVKLLTPQQVAALGPAKVSALADVCMEWGPFSEAERVRAIADLDSLALGRLLTQKRVEFDNGYSVTMGPFTTRSAADTRIAELRRQGVRDISVIDGGRGQFVISLGVFRTEPAAVAHLEELSRLGVKLARVEPRQQASTQGLLVVRDPQQAVVARIKELQSQYPGSEIKVGGCERVS